MRPIGELFRRTIQTQKGKVGLSILSVYLFAGFLGPAISPYDPLKPSMIEFLSPASAKHFLGTDEFGRDLLTRLIYGTRVSVFIAVIASTIGFILGGALGLISAYYARVVDMLIMRFVDILLAFPSLILAIAVAVIIGPGALNIGIAIGIYSIPVFARLARTLTQQVLAQQYVTAARCLGASDLRIMVYHIFPNILPSLFVIWTLRAGIVVLVAASLSYLGLGVQPPQPEWGSMLATSREYMRMAPQLIYYPGLAIVGLVLSFNLLGEALRDTLDPRLRGLIGSRYNVN